MFNDQDLWNHILYSFKLRYKLLAENRALFVNVTKRKCHAYIRMRAIQHAVLLYHVFNGKKIVAYDII